ncbi:MAG TPA: PKD domain-containing protein [Longimicrobiaceae bacterium]|nr:PKD domain-containing protein [Longimicrobiaceae bacterium]
MIDSLLRPLRLAALVALAGVSLLPHIALGEGGPAVTITLDRGLANPTVTSLGSQTLMRNTNSSVAFMVHNNSTVSQTLTFSATSSNSGAAAIYSVPSDITLIPGETRYGVIVTVHSGDSGTATITLTATDRYNYGYSGSASTLVTVGNQPPSSVSFTMNPTSASVGDSVTFSASGSDPDGDVLSYGWSFGDASGTSGNPVSHTYTSAGTYTVTATASDGHGSASTTHTITISDVLQSPTVSTPSGQSGTPGSTHTAHFTVENNSTATRSFSFVATSSKTSVVANPADPATVSIGAGQSAGVDVSYTVASTATAGSTSSISLKATDTGSTSLTQTKAFTFTTSTVLANPTLTASGSAQAHAGSTGQAAFVIRNYSNTARTFSFSVSSSNTSVARPQTPASMTLPAYSSPTGVVVNFTAGSIGTATLTLTTTDPDDYGATSSLSASVGDRAPTSVDFTLSPTSPHTGQTITFTGSATDPDGDPLSYVWGFGDQTTATGATATKIYNTPGVYNVSLSASDPWTATSASEVVRVAATLRNPSVSNPSGQSGNPSASGTASFTVTNNSDTTRTFSLSATSSNTAVVPTPSGYTTTTGALAAHASKVISVPYTISGGVTAGSTATISLKAVDGAYSATGSFTITTNTVLANPTVASSGTQVVMHNSTGSVGFPVTNNSNASRTFHFSATSSNPTAVSVQGVSADTVLSPGEVLRVALVNVASGSSGSATVTLTATDASNSNYSASASTVVNVGNQPPSSVDFTITPTSANVGQSVHFSASGSDPDGDALSYAWSIDHGSGPTGQTVDLPFSTSGLHTVSVTASDGHGGSKSASHTIPISDVLRNPSVAATSASGGRSAAPGVAVTDTFRVTNNSTGTRSFTLVAASSIPNVVADPVDPDPISNLGPSGTAMVLVHYTMASGDTAGSTSSISLTATDTGDGSLSGTGAFIVTTSTVLADPSVGAAGTQTVQHGSPGAVAFSVRNNSNTGRTFQFTASGANESITITSVPSDLWIPAGQSRGAIVNVMAGLSGSATIALTATDAGDTGYSGSASALVTVGNQAPDSVSFTMNPTSATVGESVTFKAWGSDPDGDSLQFGWAFGDQDGTSGDSVTHAYSHSGTYTVTLTASDSSQDTKSTTRTITITDVRPPTIGINPASGTVVNDANLPVTITWNDDDNLDLSRRVVSLNGDDNILGRFKQKSQLTSTVDGITRVMEEVDTATLQLRIGSNTLQAQVCDASGNCTQTVSAQYTFRTDSTPPTITAEPSLLDLALNTSGTATFHLAHSGSISESFALQVTCSDTTVVHSCTTEGDTVAVPAGATDTVLVTVVGDSSGSATVYLSATRVDVPEVQGTGGLRVHVHNLEAAIIPEVFASALDQVVASNGSGTASFAVRNPGSSATKFDLAASCTAPVVDCPSVSPSSLTLAPGEEDSASVFFQTGSAGVGELRLRAIQHGNTSATADGAARVVVSDLAEGAPILELDSATSIPVIDRGRCLTIKVADESAYECGDLRVVHALPSVRTLDKWRTPILLYNSQAADPQPLIAATVLFPAGLDSMPAQLELVVRIANHGTITHTWDSSDWPAGKRIRLVVTDDSILPALATSAYPYTVEATAIYADGTARSGALQSGVLMVVNRQQSPWGAGWWIAGLEHLDVTLSDTTGLGPEPILWVGGDGSARVYRKVSDTLWVAPSVDRPDVLISPAGAPDSAKYIRLLPGGTRVEFSASGLHRATVDRLGYRTEFQYQAGAADSVLRLIEVPTRTGSIVYGFTYLGSNVFITAPYDHVGNGTRQRNTYLTLNGGKLQYLMGQDTHRFQFVYQSGTNRLKTRYDETNHTTTYTYQSGRLHQVTRGQASTTFQPAETKGITEGVEADSVYTFMDGPRQDQDAKDYTRFWINPFGGPWKIRDALGRETVLLREDSIYPALVTRVEYPRLADGSQRVVEAMYDGRGNIETSREVDPYEEGIDAVTRYEYADSHWPDFVTRITQPEGEITEMAYDSLTGNRLWQQDGRGEVSRVSFDYEPGTALVNSITTPSERELGSDPWSYTYDDVNGNLLTETSPLGAVTTHKPDAIGRDTAVYTPIDTLRTKHTWIQYDIMDRDSIITTYGDSSEGNLVVRKNYDANGRLTAVGRKSVPNLANIGEVVDSTKYDALGRPFLKIASDEKADSTVYDLAGNPVTVFTRRYDPSTGERVSITMKYDALNRLQERVVPDLTYRELKVGIADQTGAIACDGHPSNNDSDWLTRPYPLYHNSAASDGTCLYHVAGYTEEYQYDPGTGGIVLASNADAVVRRSYFPNGALKADTLVIRTTSGAPLTAETDPSTEPHAYGLGYRYDLDGRRAAMQYTLGMPDLIGSSTDYEYDPNTGDLHRIVDPQGNSYLYEYDPDGRVQRSARGKLSSSGLLVQGLEDTYEYDDDGRVITHRVRETLPGVNKPLYRLFEHAVYNAADQRLSVNDSLTVCGDAACLGKSPSEISFEEISTANQYTRMGRLLSSWTDTKNWIYGIAMKTTADTWLQDDFTYDALGNQRSSTTTTGGWDTSGDYHNGRYLRYDESQWWNDWQHSSQSAYEQNTGRLLSTTRLVKTDTATETFRYNEAGDLEQQLYSGHAGATRRDRVSFFSADGRLRATDARTWYYEDEDGASLNQYDSFFEEYRYDALGRRIWVRTRRQCNETIADSVRHGPTNACNEGLERRVVWDGNQELYEIQMPETRTDSTQREKDAGPIAEQVETEKDGGIFDLNPFFGRVLYTHGLGTDQPLGVLRLDYRDFSLYQETGSDWPEATYGAAWTPPDSPFTLFPLWNLRGQALGSGNGLDCAVLPFTVAYLENHEGRCVATNWNPMRRAFGQAPEGERAWHGTLLENKTDASGLMYRRNRYYDPGTGRFTQEDPIGLAGGLNLYGYAAGDPVNFSDPFGLCTPMPDCLAGLGSLQDWWTNVKAGAAQAASDAAVAGKEFWANHKDEIITGAVMIISEGRARGAAGEAGAGMRWPSTPAEMDELLRMPGTRVPDGPNTPGRGKVMWRPNADTKIIYEQHPYHPDAPEYHRGPHWHLETPAEPHGRYLPGDEIPGQ